MSPYLHETIQHWRVVPDTRCLRIGGYVNGQPPFMITGRVINFNGFIVKTYRGKVFRLGIAHDTEQICRLRHKLREFAKRKRRRQKYGRLLA